MILLDGKKVSQSVCENLRKDIENLKAHNIIPKLVIIQVGNNEASNVYVRNKLRLSEKLGAITEIKKISENISTGEIISIIKKLNTNKSVHGILVQMPLPKHINHDEIFAAISPNKDVDCFNLYNIGKVWSASKSEVHLKPCTPAGIIELLKYYKIPITEKNAVIIGRSNIVGKPMASLLLLEDATVTLCHSKTKNLHKVCKKADILIAAIGKANAINSTYVKKGATVIDVGINHTNEGILCGDVDFNSVKKLAKYITPVPGGVGPMTVTMLMKNLVELAKLQSS